MKSMTALLSPEEQWLNTAEKLATDYAHGYAFVGCDTMPRRRAALMEHLRSRPAVVQEPVAWICTKRLTGDKAVFDIPCTTANYEYVKAHPDHDWAPLYAAPSPAQKETQ